MSDVHEKTVWMLGGLLEDQAHPGKRLAIATIYQVDLSNQLARNAASS
jgi:hypothetical protein